MNATATPAGTLPEAVAPEAPVATTAEACSSIIKRYCLWSAGAGIIPLPLLDLVLISGIQVKMVYELAKEYKIPFDESRAKTVIGALIGSLVPYGVASSSVMGGLASLTKAIPVVGPLLTWTFCPALASASTYAVGRVFEQHFATGGTLLSFDAEKMREHFQKEFEAARQSVKTKTDSSKA